MTNVELLLSERLLGHPVEVREGDLPVSLEMLIGAACDDTNWIHIVVGDGVASLRDFEVRLDDIITETDETGLVLCWESTSLLILF